MWCTLAGSNAVPGTPDAGEDISGWIDITVTISRGVAQYPEGAKRLRGVDREYIVAPLMSIIEEAYTVYFDFQQPSVEQDAVAYGGQSYAQR